MDGSITESQALALAPGQGGGLWATASAALLIQGLGYTLAWILVIAVGIARVVLLMGPLLAAPRPWL